MDAQVEFQIGDEVEWMPTGVKGTITSKRFEGIHKRCFVLDHGKTQKDGKIYNRCHYSNLRLIRRKGMYKKDDVLTDGRNEMKVLGVCGDVFFMSNKNNFDMYSSGHTKLELEKDGFRLKSSDGTVELTIQEISDKFGIDSSKVRIKEDK